MEQRVGVILKQMSEPVYIVGARDENYKPPPEISESSFKVECCKCKKPVWIMVFNLEKTAICMQCAFEQMKDNKDVQLGVTSADAKTIREHIKSHPKE